MLLRVGLGFFFLFLEGVREVSPSGRYCGADL